ncbi:MAG: hypothetical protein NTW20_08860 [Rhodobacterales bacterium]|nr:hypothetical protein [Rhodobacterales bacterium]
MREAEITVFNRYRFLAPREKFLAAVAALAQRVEGEGHPGVLDYRFYLSAAKAEGRAVVRYRDADAWVGHHEIIMAWPEMAAFRAVAALEQVDLHGAITLAMRDWIDRMGLTDKVMSTGASVAGFGR